MYLMEFLTSFGISPDQQLTLMAWGIGGSFIALLLAGMTNRVVVFASGGDLMWTLSIFLAPIASFVIAVSLVPEGKEFEDETVAMVVMGVGGVIAVVGCLKTIFSSIKHNGLVLGIVIAIFKILAAVLAAVCAIGFLGKIFEDNASFASRMIGLVFFGLLLWVMRKLINGDEVRARRSELKSA